MAAIGEPVLRYEPQFIPPFRRCCDRIVELIRRVAVAIFQFTARIFIALCCRRLPPRPLDPGRANVPPRLEIDEDDVQPIPVQIVPIRQPAEPGLAAPAPEAAGAEGQGFEIPEMPQAPDLAPFAGRGAALDRCRRYLRGEVFVAPQRETLSQLTARDFIALYNEFPANRPAIIEWSIEAAQARTIRIDPNHPFFEIFRTFLRDRVNYGGAAQSGDYRDYEVGADYSGRAGREYYNEVSTFVYTIYSLIGFQELTREENRIWLRMIDNGGATFEANPAYRYGRALSKMFTYPTRPANVRWDDLRPAMDIRDKIHHGMNAPWRAYSAAKFMHELPLFFQQSFGNNGYNEHCFDARINAFQRFMERYLAIPDFTPDIGIRHDNNHRTLEHYRVAKNLQIAAFARARNLGFREAMHWINQYGADGIEPARLIHARDLENRPIDEAQRVEINALLLAFHRDYFQPADFERYLDRAGQPLKQMIPVYDIREHRMLQKPQGPALARNERMEGGVRIEGWEPILRRNYMWPDHWEAPPAQA